MAKEILKYTIFLASPNDLSEERQAVDEVVKELNLTYGQKNNIVLEVLKWETHSAPGISLNHQQEIINMDIGDEYDIFIGLLWKKFGTKTKSSDSGTEEEFMNAYNRFTNNHDNIQILFYFKTSSPKSLNELNPEEFLKVEKFKNNISQKNVYYWEFDTTENLKNFLRIHIPKRIETISEAQDLSIKRQTIIKTDTSNEDELGLFDYTEIFENAVSIALNSLGKITEATEWIGHKISEKAEEITRISKSSNPNSIVIKEVFKRTAILMNDYSSRINIETPIFYANFEETIKAGSNIINLTDDFYQDNTISDLEDTKESIFQLETGINQAVIGMTGFYDSVKELPRIQKEINLAKRNLLQNLDFLIEKFKQSMLLAKEYKMGIVNKIDKLKIEKKKPEGLI
ncbi:MAG: DUF4062 domain-containing protein [Bacteroidales bacterium]